MWKQKSKKKSCVKNIISGTSTCENIKYLESITLFPEMRAIAGARVATHANKYVRNLSHAQNPSIFTFCYVIIIYFT